MGFFDSLKKIDFGKVGDVFGKVATQTGNFVSAYGKGQGSTGSKILSGLGSIDIGQVFQAASQVKNQVDNVRKTVEVVDVPQQAMDVISQEGFIKPVQTNLSEKQSTGMALGALEQTTNLLTQQTGENLRKVSLLQDQLKKTQYKLNQYFDKQDQIGRGRLLQITAPLMDQIDALNKQIEVVTNKIIREQNSHQPAMNAMSNTIRSLSNSPILSNGVRMYENRMQTEYRGLPRKNMEFIQIQAQIPQMRRNFNEAMVPKQYSGYDFRQYENAKALVGSRNNSIMKYKPIRKTVQRYRAVDYQDEDEDQDEEDMYDEDEDEDEYDY